MGLRQQQFNIFGGQVADKTVLRADDGVGKVSFAFLQLQHLFLDRVAGDQAIGKNLAHLADAMGAVDRLRLHGGVPPGIENKDIVGGGKVQTHTTGLKADKKETAAGILLEPLHPRLAVDSLPVEILVFDSIVVKTCTKDREQTGELGEDQCLVAFVEDRMQLLDAERQALRLGL